MTMMPVVVADDEPQIRSLIKAVVSKQGLPVVEAEDGLTALSVIQKLNGKVCLLVSDVQMPNLDGKSLCRQVKSTFPSIPVLLMSGAAALEEFKLGDAFLQKPFSSDLLLRLISVLCSPTVRPAPKTT